MIDRSWQNRTQLLLGDDKLSILTRAKVLVAGLGGVGGYAAEQLCRAGVGELILVDCDIVQPSNRNRQIIALKSTVGKNKTEVLASRLEDINPEIKLTCIRQFLTEENIPEVLDGKYSYVVDAIDTLSPKVALLEQALKNQFPVISSMGSGGKLAPELIRVCDIAKSHSCKLAFKVRKALHQRGIHSGIKVVYSPEKVAEHAVRVTDGSGNKRSEVGTISYMPAIFGCYCASEIIRDLLAVS